MEIYITSEFYENAVYLVLRDDDISIQLKISEENTDGRIVVDDKLRRRFLEIYAQLCEITKGDEDNMEIYITSDFIAVDDNIRRRFLEIYAQLCEITKGDEVNYLLQVARSLSYDDFRRLFKKMCEYL